MPYNIDVYRPNRVQDEVWRDLQVIARDAYSETVQRSRGQIDLLVNWHDVQAFKQLRVDANDVVGSTLSDNQSFFDQKLAIARAGRYIVGYALSAHNVSGNSAGIRAVKRLGKASNYLCFREIAVKPDFQRYGVGTLLCEKLLHSTSSSHPVTAYIWPDEQRFMQPVLEKRGFAETSEMTVYPFGSGSQPVRQVRMAAPSVQTVLERIALSAATPED